MKIETGKIFLKRFGYFTLYAITAILLFLPVINKYFVSDDFTVLKRVCLDRSVLADGFFRPLPDIFIYLNYLVAGFNPFGFNLVNILLHAFNSYLLFCLCCRWIWTPDIKKQRRFAFMASVLFLAYPFHNESIVWLLGRGSSLAGTCCISSLLIFFSSWKNSWKCFGVCISYFVGLLAYESIIILPVMICVLLVEKQICWRGYFQWGVAMLITIVAHFIFRYKFSAAIFGNYGAHLFKTSWGNYPANILKVITRLIIPPTHDTVLFVALAVVVMAIMLLLLLLVYTRLKNKKIITPFVLTLFGMFSCALIVPFLFGVSTKTSESDRFLYLPSFFLCCSISYVINRYIILPASRRMTFASLCVCSCIFLEINNLNWFRASNASDNILRTLKSDTSSKIFIVNLPNEINGAYIFREGFLNALIINKIDTSRITVINKLPKEPVGDANETWIPVYFKTKILIPPRVQIMTGAEERDAMEKKPGTINYTVPPVSKLYYWDQRRFVLLKMPAHNL